MQILFDNSPYFFHIISLILLYFYMNILQFSTKYCITPIKTPPLIADYILYVYFLQKHSNLLPGNFFIDNQSLLSALLHSHIKWFISSITILISHCISILHGSSYRACLYNFCKFPIMVRVSTHAL